MQLNPFLKTSVPSVAPHPGLCTAHGSGCAKLLCLWALGPTSILSRLKCRSKMHSPCLLGFVPSHSVPRFFSHWRKTEMWRSVLCSAIPLFGWKPHAQICSRLVLLVAEWCSHTHSLLQHRAIPLWERPGGQAGCQPSQAHCSSCPGELLWQRFS